TIAGGSGRFIMMTVTIAPAATTAVPIAANPTHRLLDGLYPVRPAAVATAPADPLSVVGTLAMIGSERCATGAADTPGPVRIAVAGTAAVIVRQRSSIALTSAALAGRIAGSFASSAMTSWSSPSGTDGSCRRTG